MHNDNAKVGEGRTAGTGNNEKGNEKGNGMPKVIDKNRKVEAKEFVMAWQRGESVEEVARKLGLSVQSASSRAAHLRTLGVELKKFPRGRAMKLDINELNNLVHQLERKAS